VDAPRGAVQQAHAQPVLQLGQAPADRRRGDAHLLRSRGQAAFLHEQGKEAQVRKAIHGCL